MKKKASDKHVDPELLPEYDFRGGVRGKYTAQYDKGTNVMVIDPDVLEFFPDHDAVNSALRGLAEIIKRRNQTKPSRTSRRATPEG